MNKHHLAFADINLINTNIVEIIIHAGTNVTLEMSEEFDAFIDNYFDNEFAVLVNKVHLYTFDYEARLVIGSHENLKAIAVINYSNEGHAYTDKLNAQRKIDSWNLKSFSGLDLGWQQGIDWLQAQLVNK